MDALSETAVRAITPETAKAAAENLKALRKGADESILAAHKALVEVIKSIKMGLNKKTATTTPVATPPTGGASTETAQ